jgi:hypothetical protein
VAIVYSLTELTVEDQTRAGSRTTSEMTLDFAAAAVKEASRHPQRGPQEGGWRKKSRG